MYREQLLLDIEPIRKRRSGAIVSRRQGRWWFEQIRKAIEEACGPQSQRGKWVQPHLPLAR